MSLSCCYISYTLKTVIWYFSCTAVLFWEISLLKIISQIRPLLLALYMRLIQWATCLIVKKSLFRYFGSTYCSSKMAHTRCYVYSYFVTFRGVHFCKTKLYHFNKKSYYLRRLFSNWLAKTYAQTSKYVCSK